MKVEFLEIVAKKCYWLSKSAIKSEVSYEA